MEPLGRVQPGAAASGSSSQPIPELGVQFHDTLAAGDRLWVRGRVTVAAPAGNGNGEKRIWWKPWRKNGEQVPPPLRLETTVSGQVLQAELTADGHGNFDGLLSAPLPPARRGWRIARNRVALNGHSAESCNVVLLTPGSAVSVAVILPLTAAWPAGGGQNLAGSSNTLEVLPRLQSLRRTTGRSLSMYYVALVPPDAELHRPDLAIAITALGWPSGPLLTFPGERQQVSATLAMVMDRLRWLLYGTRDFGVLNLEPELIDVLASSMQSCPDRAQVQNLSESSDSDRATFIGAPRVLARPTRAALLPRYPVVFCHGMLGYSMLKWHRPTDINYFSSLRSFLDPRGVQALFPKVGPTSGVAERAEQLRDQIVRWTDEPINIVAHSMGGLDARHLISHLGMASRVRSLTTIATPHRGSFMADWFQANFRRRVPVLLALEAVGFNVDGFQDCRPTMCRDFNSATPNATNVRYFSFGADVPPARLTPFLRRAWGLLTPVEGPNDGLVSVQSARWGEYLGTIQADHFAQTPDGVFVRDGEDFDALGFYVRLIEDLARRGF